MIDRGQLVPLLKMLNLNQRKKALLIREAQKDSMVIALQMRGKSLKVDLG